MSITAKGMRFKRDEDILDPKFRKQILSEIRDTENLERKQKELRKHEIYRDRIHKWVMAALRKEGLKDDTLVQMENRVAQISIARKIVNKLGRLYVGGVERLVPDDLKSQEAISTLAKLMDTDSKMKKADRYRILFRNSMIQVIPELVIEESTEQKKKFKLKKRTFAPWQYDVLEDSFDREIPRVVILSDFVDRNLNLNDVTAGDVSPGEVGKTAARGAMFQATNRRDDVIADAPEDAGMDGITEFIWWNRIYHFTTDQNGEIITKISPENLLNPIQMLNFCPVNTDQDQEFWAQGGDDLIDGSVLVNQLLTDMFSIMYVQGWGQPVITGKNLFKEDISGGPHTAIILDYDPNEGDPKPTVDFVNSNPPIDSWMRAIEQYVALLLSTNNLAPGNVSGKLDATNPASGIAQLIENSQVVESLEDAQKHFQFCEKQIWEIVRLWQNLLLESDSLIEPFKEVGAFESSNVVVKFNDLKPVITEEQKLNELKLRKELGISTELDLIRMDNPEMDDDQVKEKLLEIKEEKLQRIKDGMILSLGGKKDGQNLRGTEQETTESQKKEEEKEEEKQAV